jgi:hypothetical protein
MMSIHHVYYCGARTHIFRVRTEIVNCLIGNECFDEKYLYVSSRIIYTSTSLPLPHVTFLVTSAACLFILPRRYTDMSNEIFIKNTFFFIRVILFFFFAKSLLPRQNMALNIFI